MFTRTIRSAKTILPLFIALTLTASSNAFSQSYHHRIKIDSSITKNLDSSDANHLQVQLRQVEGGMKFHLVALNFSSRYMDITIRKGEDVLFSEIIREDLYDHIFNLSTLEDGKYEVLVSNGKEKVVRNIVIGTRVDRQLTVN